MKPEPMTLALGYDVATICRIAIEVDVNGKGKMPISPPQYWRVVSMYSKNRRSGLAEDSGVRVVTVTRILVLVSVIVTCFASATYAQSFPVQPNAEDLNVVESSKKFTESYGIADWMGPLAPIALSPFFGLACLSGIATFGPEWLQQRSMFGGSSMLNNPLLFWSMAVLTIVTSLPRLSKVSKPIALAAEKLETYSVIIIMIAMRLLSGSEDGGVESVTFAAPGFLSAGIATMPLDLVIGLVTAVNIFVINGVKVFFEFIVWLSPIPTIDAIAEVANKMLSACLMAVYVWSPLLATVLNLIVLAACAMVFLWTQRRLAYYIDMIVCPIAAIVFGSWASWRYAENTEGKLAFLAKKWNGLPAYTRLRIRGSVIDGWTVTRWSWWNRIQLSLPAAPCNATPGLFGQQVRVGDDLTLMMLDENPGTPMHANQVVQPIQG
ncbi:MAG: hypothetical protein NTW52_10675 [Planctomycetota bacterium]|nr:hypothetical protein [Planctomycetota bacterium]